MESTTGNPETNGIPHLTTSEPFDLRAKVMIGVLASLVAILIGTFFFQSLQIRNLHRLVQQSQTVELGQTTFIHESRCREQITQAAETRFRHNIGVILDAAAVPSSVRTPQQIAELRQAAADIKAAPDPFIEMTKKCTPTKER